MSDDSYVHPETTSTDGFLVGGHPEKGDLVYAPDGTELGKVEFFYANVSTLMAKNNAVLQIKKFLVKIDGVQEDPALVVVADIVEDFMTVGKRLVLLAGQASQAQPGPQGVMVIVQNHA